MTSKSTDQIDVLSANKAGSENCEFEVIVTSFGYKQGPPPNANVVFDVRFLKNPYWVEELRPLTGRDRAVQQYVLEQPLAKDFLESVTGLLSKIIPKMAELKTGQFVIAFGCTGGQHRSATLVEVLALRLHEQFPQYMVVTKHRELGITSHLDGDKESSVQS